MRPPASVSKGLRHDIDFLPEGIRDARARRRLLRLRIVLIAAVVATLGGGHALVRRRLGFLELQKQYAEEKVAGLKARLGQLALQRSREQELRETAGVIARLLGQPLSSRALGELVNLVPEKVVLLSCSLRPAAAAAPRPGREPAPGEAAPQVVVEGGAPSHLELAALIARLANLKLFEDLEFVYSKKLERKGEDLKRFEIRFKVKA
jgi:Tfp pilus assembly protein PilN